MLEINKNRKRYIYGAGYAGKVLAGYLSFIKNAEVEAIVVSDGHKEMDTYFFPKTIMKKSIPILEYGSLPDTDNTIDFYVTLDKQKEDIIEMLQKDQNFSGGGSNRRNTLSAGNM